MSGTMNGAPYYAPPHRHQKNYMSRLGSLAEDVLKPELAELPGLVADAIRKGLIKRPDPSGLVPTPILKSAPLADWQTVNCTDCGVTFERHKRTLTKCKTCRIPMRDCKNCGTHFRPPSNTTLCCSSNCSQAQQVANLKAQHDYTKALPKVAECIICHQIKPVRPSGSGVAKTCSPECSKEYRAIRNAERKTK
jgi:hypothetical protein